MKSDFSIFEANSNAGYFTKTELHKDYEEVDWAENNVKKQLAEKYSCGKKAKEIKDAIVLKLRDIRVTQKTFDKQDITDFYRFDWNERNLSEFLDKENIEFVQYFAEELKKRIPAIPRSVADKYKQRIYNKCLAWLTEAIKTDEDKMNDKKQEDIMNLLIEKFNNLLSDFRKTYLDRVRKSANNKYTNLPNEIKNLQKQKNILDKKYDEFSKDRTKSYINYRFIEKINRKINNFKYILKKYTLKQYEDACVEEANKQFDVNVRNLSDRVKDKGFDIEKITVTHVDTDPKIFEIMITDQKKKLYCRSVLAAEYSTKMIPHFRFIMTERK